MKFRNRIGSVGCLLFLHLVATAHLAVAQPANLDDVVLFARDQVVLNPGTRLASGHIVVNSPEGIVIASPQFKALPDLAPQLITNRLLVPRYKDPLGPQIFDLFTNIIDDTGGGLIVQGTLTRPLGFSLPLFPFPSPPVVTPGTMNVRVRRRNSPQVLQPGDYGIVRVGSDGVLYLAGGTYNLLALRVGSRAQLLANGTTTINVAEKVRFLGRANFGAADPQLNGRCVVVNTAWDKTVAFGRFADVTATVNAPAARLRLGRAGSYRGNFTAASVTVGRSAVLQTLPPLLEACP